MADCAVFYRFVSCCDGTEILFCRQGFLADGGYKYNGTGLVGFGGTLETGYCYTVIAAVTPPNTTVNYPYLTTADLPDFDSTGVTGCDNPDCFECPKKIVFQPCCGGQVIEFADDPDYIGINPSLANQYTGTDLIFDGLGGVLIPNGCYQISRVNATGQNLIAPPNVNDIIYAGGKSCSSVTVECTPCTYFYQITNCSDQNEVYCTTSNLSAYINNQIIDEALWPVIQVTQYPDKCFYVEQVISCTGAVPITPVSSLPTYIGCEECQQTLMTYYELINCNDPAVIIYTSTDLQAYVGQYITLIDYGDECFYVSVAQDVTGVVTVEPKDPFSTCEECTLPTYQLDDCLGIAETIVTNTDLSAYIGDVITLSTCPDICWTVSESILSSHGAVYINTPYYRSCSDCLANTLTAKCVTFTNTSGSPITFTYTDTDGQSGNRITLEAGEFTSKDCYLQWDEVAGITVTQYGDCIDNTCPTVIPLSPKRRVTPGYDTPACTAEYYENVECNFSEWMYKDVLEKRYGISNCCPDELMKWEIKHEMLMLDALINPDYTCQETTCCSAPVSTCTSCGCSSCNC